MVRSATPQKLLTVGALTTGLNVPSARFRIRQYIPALARHGVQVIERAARFSSYPPPEKVLRPFWGVATLANRVPQVCSSWRYDLCVIQRELVSTLFTLERFVGKPRVFDVDDAIFLRRGGRAARRIAESCDSVVCGNVYIAETFRRWNANVVVIPTAVDTARFCVRPESEPEIIVGWSGGVAGLPDLYMIEPAIATVLRKHSRAKLLVLCDEEPVLRCIPPGRIEFVKWSAGVEAATFRRVSIGLMPLRDTPHNRGKCSYKMLLHMSCGSPVVVSPVGMNRDVLRYGDLGFGPTSMSDWTDTLDTLVVDRKLRKEMGRCARAAVVENFSVELIAERMAKHFRRVAGTCSG